VACSRIYHFLIENGHQIISNPSQADFIIINTCGALKIIEDKSIALYRKYHPLKKENAIIIMYGCLTMTNEKRLQDLDIYPVGNYDDDKLDELFFTKIKFENIKPTCDEETKVKLIDGRVTHVFLRYYPFIATKMVLPFSKKLRLKYNQILKDLTHENRLFVEISKGCTGNCSYCVIKKAKGDLISRKINDIIEDIKSIYDPSKILFLAADDCGCYGADIGSSLTELIYEINKVFPNITIDLNYLNPRIMQDHPEEYVKLFKNSSLRYVIIPLENGSNKIIKKMNRKYDVKKILRLTDRIKKVSPSSILYAHFILGFPGERITDFIKTLLAALHFDIPLPFIYIPMRKITTTSDINWKPNFNGIFRHLVFMIFANIVILLKISSYHYIPEMKIEQEK
jgi:tRNA A37 methylthiotransferase MiaB